MHGRLVAVTAANTELEADARTLQAELAAARRQVALLSERERRVVRDKATAAADAARVLDEQLEEAAARAAREQRVMQASLRAAKAAGERERASRVRAAHEHAEQLRRLEEGRSALQAQALAMAEEAARAEMLETRVADLEQTNGMLLDAKSTLEVRIHTMSAEMTVSPSSSFRGVPSTPGSAQPSLMAELAATGESPLDLSEFSALASQAAAQFEEKRRAVLARIARLSPAREAAASPASRARRHRMRQVGWPTAGCAQCASGLCVRA